MKRLWQVSNILTLFFALVMNGLVGAKLVGLPGIEEKSAQYTTLLTPAGYAFSIWSLIYGLLIVFVIYQARDMRRPRAENTLPGRIGPLFSVASIANGLWTYIFVQDYVGLSVAVLLLLTASLYVMLWRLSIAMDDVPMRVIACVWWPLLLYTGWVSVATVVNVASWLDSRGVEISPPAASMVLIGLGVLLLGLLVKRNVRELLLASAWGIAAVGVHQHMQGGDHLVTITAFSVSGGLLLATLLHGYQNRHQNPFYAWVRRRVATAAR